MIANQLPLPGVFEIVPGRHEDARGYFSETYRQDWFASHVADVGFVQENQSLSRAVGTVRGMHFQKAPFVQGKLVRCIQGAIFDVAVDLRRGSPGYGKWAGVELTAEKGNQLWIPGGFGHGFCTLRPDTIVCYKVTAVYSREDDMGFAWNDTDVAVEWPAIADPSLLSAKDAAQPRFADLPAYFEFGG